MVGVGIDVGSISAKAVVYDGQLKSYVIKPTGWSPKDAGRQVFVEALAQAGYGEEDMGYVVGTGYGRVALSFSDKSLTEITCHARGIHYLFRNAPLIIDIGGQDSKVIIVDTTGRVVDFVMNDKCAAGTGRFLEVMATALGLDICELASFANNANPVAISSMCTVFAESEVISLLAQGTPKECIVAGIHQSIARRVRSMLKTEDLGETVIFTGGVAKNTGVKLALEKELGAKVIVPEEPQITGALGAAIIAYQHASENHLL